MHARVLGGVAGAAVAVLGSLGVAPASHASNLPALNGTYHMVSNGEWAKGNDVFYDQPTVVQTVTIKSSCVSPIECTGEMHSDQGWTATGRLDDFWIFDHDIPNWVPCPDGTFAPGHQKFIMSGVNPQRNERNMLITDFLMGRDQTKSASGACGVNKPVVIELPMTMTRIGD
jgi:hypothetical protein